MVSHRIAFIYRAIMTFYSPIPAILAINFGWGAKAVGIIAALTSMGSLFSNYFWPRYAAKAEKAGVISLGFLGIILGALLLQNSKTLILAVIVMSLLPDAAYYFLLEGVRRKRGKLSKNVSSFYRSESAGMLGGSVLGAISSYVLSESFLPFVLLGASILSVLISMKYLDHLSVEPTPKRGIVEERLVTSKKMKKFGLKYVGEIGLTRKMLPYLFMSGLFSLSFSLIYPQLPVIVEMVFGNASLFYTFTILARVFGTLAYKLAGSLNHKSFWIGWPIRLLAFLLIAATRFTKWALPVFFLVAGFGWAFIKTFYGIMNLESGEKLTSLNLVVRSLFYTLGSAVSGTLMVSIGFVGSALISSLLFFLAPWWLIATNKNIREKRAQSQ